MPVGYNKIVPRFVKGHVYKLYYPLSPEHYAILRFRQQGHRTIQGLRRQVYMFYTLAAWKPFREIPIMRFDQVNNMNVEEVILEDLPRYIGAPFVTKEFERVLRGENIVRRKLSKVKK